VLTPSEQYRHLDRDSGAPHSVVDRVMLVLGAFDGGEGELGLSEIARRSGLPKSTVHRLVGELAQHGMLGRRGNLIVPGMRLFELGALVARSDLRAAALPHMADLRAATRQTVHLAVLHGHEVVYVEILRHADAPPLPSRVGGRMPAHATGVGKAILAACPPEVVDAVLDSPLRRLAERTITAPDILRRELAVVRQRGVAYDFGEARAGLVCAASAVCAPDGAVSGALSITGWAGRLDVRRMAPAVRTAALATSRSLGAGDHEIEDSVPG
jgi:DNA-binding IclR family transcriptional regulator